MRYTLNNNVENQNTLKNFIETMDHVRELIHSTLDFDELMNRLILVASKAIQSEKAAISIREGDKWVIRYTYGLSDDIRGKLTNDNEERHAVLAINTKKPVIIEDAFHDSRVNREHIIKCGVRSVIVVPLITKEHAIGVVFFNFYKKVYTFNELTVEFVNSLSTAISMALQNVKLYEMSCAELDARKKAVNKYKTLFNSINEGFCIIDIIFNPLGKPVNFRYIEVNPAFQKQTGLKNAEGKLIKDLIPDIEENWIEIYGKVALTGEPMRFIKEVKVINRWFNVDAFRIDTEDIGNVGVLFKDITEAINVKKELEKNIKVQDEIFTNVSHELKTPLSVILSTTQLLELYLKKDSLDVYKDKVARSVNTIKQNCYRFTKLINNIVDLSKMDSGFFRLSMKNENIVEMVENIVHSVSDYIKENGLCIIFDTDIEEKVINCDPEKIERILLNLISNAIKFSNKGNEIYVKVVDEGEFVEISVRDTGVGIDKKYFDSIFERFHQIDKTLTRNAEGSGIGLSLVKSIVELHGGKINVESEIGKGSIFKVLLPARTVIQSKDIDKNKHIISNNVQMINIEFSDIYHL